MECVLIIDSDELLLFAITRALQAYSPEVKAVSTGGEALKEISSRFYHLVFVDIALPGLNGLQILQKIAETSPETKIVVMTGVLVDDQMRARIEEYSFHMMAKPFEISELKEVAREALARPVEESYAVGRRLRRVPTRKTVNYLITVLEMGKPINLSLKGDIVDINESGIGLRTFYPLEPGHLLMFPSGLEHTNQKAGVVRWSTITDESCMYRVGIEFMREGLSSQEGPSALSVKP